MLYYDNIRPGPSPVYRTKAPTWESLPPANTARWVASRKAEVVAAVDSGLLSVAQACQRYALTLEELASWQRAVEREGVPGLRATRVQHYRQAHERQSRHI